MDLIFSCDGQAHVQARYPYALFKIAFGFHLEADSSLSLWYQYVCSCFSL